MLTTIVLSAVLSKPACALPETDRAWVDRAIDAWRFTSREITGIKPVHNVHTIFFSADCVLSSANGLGARSSHDVRWTATPHSGTIALPDGSEIPARVTSFASGKHGVYYFVMSTPTVWEAAGIKGVGLIPVMLHEASHVAQIGPYGPRLGALIDRNKLPDSFNDDAVQECFQGIPEFDTSVKQEMLLFTDAAEAVEDADARTLAREARRLMRERQARWYAGDKAYFAEAEDIWLTFEGAGQWTGFQWLVHPRGGAQRIGETTARFTRGRWWSQTEGFAVVMALDRIAGPSWKRHAFGDGQRTVLEMLDDALGD